MYPSFDIKPVEPQLALELNQHVTNLGYPESSLGSLVTIAERLVCAQRTLDFDLGELAHIVFCADHGSYERSHASKASSTTSAEHVNRLVKNKSPAAKACALNLAELTVIDCGLNTPLSTPYENLLELPVGNGTKDFSMMPAMTQAQFIDAMNVGKEIAQLKMAEGARVLSFGALGLGGTTSAAAITSNLLKLPVDDCIRNTHTFDEQLSKDKSLLLTQALMLHRDAIIDGFKSVEYMGGFEMAALMGAMAITAELGGVFLIDGYVPSAALLALAEHYPFVVDYALFTHQSVHAGQTAICRHFKQTPLLNLGFALGEGTGSILAWPLITTVATCLSKA